MLAAVLEFVLFLGVVGAVGYFVVKKTSIVSDLRGDGILPSKKDK